jgi:MYXO-CTERM domain-containing protein
MRRESLVCALGVMTAFGAVAWTPQVAEACGGTFCDGGPIPMPVDQSGENILFVRDGDFTEAHIQIQYQGEAQDFAWVIPLQVVPEFSVGSEPMFQNLLAGSVPTYLVQTQFDDCDVDNGASGGLTGGDAGGTGAAGEDGADSAGEDPGGPEVILQETVGAYEIAVLQGGTAAEVVEWLDANGYAQDDEAEPILASYLEEGFLFGAVKLTGGADVDEIHPIVLRMPIMEACIPLRLTRIAAVEDMDVRSFFLGAARTVPQNYRHVLINQVKIDWTPGALASNYKEIITQAVDAPTADGRAFVTEFAGSSDVVPRGGLYSPSWNSPVFETIEPIGVIDELTNQGLFFCDFDFGNGCAPTHPLVQPIIDEFLPVPAGVDAEAFYQCVSCYEDQLDLMAWNGVEFAAALQQRVIDPGQHANSLLDANPYLSRLYTTISPGEMTEDPLFHENSELADVPNNLTGTQRVLCNGDSVYILPDGRQVYLPAGGVWPDFDSEPAWSMPSDEEVQEVMAAGAPVVLANNTQHIDDALDAYNAAQGWAGGGANSGGDDSGNAASGGCGCRTSGGGMAGALAMLLGLGLGLASRRRPLV